MKKKIAEKSKRLLSLDCFRGITIFFMILVNNGAGMIYSKFGHASWNGWTLADTVAPFFLWIIGMSMVFSFNKRLKSGEDKKLLFMHALKRAAILFVVGLFLNLFPYFNFATMRITGTLQRIAVCYLIASIIVLYSKERWQAIWTVIFLAAYWAILIFVPVPGYGTGILAQEGNIVQYVDNLILGPHMKQPFDAGGILSTIPAIASVLFGALIGNFLIKKMREIKKIRYMLIGSIILIISGYIMNIWMPINKNLWTSSFTVLMAGLALISFSALYLIIDVKGYKKWTKPFIIFGMNAIILYSFGIMLSHILDAIKINGVSISYAVQTNMYSLILPSLDLFGRYASILTEKITYSVYVLIYTSIIYSVAYIFYKKKWFIKI